MNPTPIIQSLESRLLLAGQLDSSFPSGGLLINPNLTAALDVAMQSNGKIVAAGYRNEGAAAGHRNMVITRYNKNGSLDADFGSGGEVTLDFGQSSIATALAIAKNGDIVVAGGLSSGSSTGADIALARLNKNGSLIASFGTGGLLTTSLNSPSPEIPSDIAIDNRGRIIVAARSSLESGHAWTIARYNRVGNLDNNFADNGLLNEPLGTLKAIRIVSGNKILAAGSLSESCAINSPACTTTSAALIQYTAAGERDNSFSNDGLAQRSFFTSGQTSAGGSAISAFTDLAMQGNRIIAVGLAADSSRSQPIAARFTSRGLLDNHFSAPANFLPNDLTLPSGSDVKVAVQPDRKILIGFTSSTLIGREQTFAISRLKPGGGFDDSFDGDGRSDIFFDDQLSTLHALAIQPSNGRVIAAGRAFDVSPGNPESGSLALAALDGFSKNAGRDNAAPHAILLRRPDHTGASSRFSVRYIDNNAVDRSTIGDGDVVITGPNGFSQTANLVRITGPNDDLRATYQFPAPGGHWNRADEGRYTITLRPRQVSDTAGNFIPSATLGRFRVSFPPRNP